MKNFSSLLYHFVIIEEEVRFSNFHMNMSVDEIYGYTKIDRWFLVQIKEIVDFEEELAGARN